MLAPTCSKNSSMKRSRSTVTVTSSSSSLSLACVGLCTHERTYVQDLPLHTQVPRVQRHRPTPPPRGLWAGTRTGLAVPSAPSHSKIWRTAGDPAQRQGPCLAHWCQGQVSASRPGTSSLAYPPAPSLQLGRQASLGPAALSGPSGSPRPLEQLPGKCILYSFGPVVYTHTHKHTHIFRVEVLLCHLG